MQIKISMSYHCIPIKIAIIRKKEKIGNICWIGCGKLEPSCMAGWECKNDVAIMEHGIRGFLKKLKAELPYEPTIPVADERIKVSIWNPGLPGRIRVT